MFKKFLIILLIVLTIVLGIWFYARERILPRLITVQLQTIFKEKLHLDLTVGEVDIRGLAGVSVRDIKVYHGKDNLVLNIPLSRGSLLVPGTGGSFFAFSMSLVDPELYVRRDKEGEWNIQKIIEGAKEDVSGDRKETPKPIIRKIEIKNLKVYLSDRTNDLSLLLDNINAAAAIKIKGVDLNLQSNSRVINLDFKGLYSFSGQHLEGDLKVRDFHAVEFKDYYGKAGDYIEDLLVQELSSSLKISSAGMEAEGDAISRNIKGFYEDIHIQGGLSSHFKLTYDLKDTFNYRVKNTIDTIDIKGLPYVNALSLLKGEFIVEDGSIEIQGIKGNLWDNEFFIEGMLVDFSNPQVRISCNYPFPLKELQRMVSKELPFAAEGVVNTAISLEGLLKEYKNLALNIKGDSSEVLVKNRFLKAPLLLSALEFSYDYRQDLLNWQIGKIPFFDVSLSCKGEINDVRNPDVSFELSSPDVSVKGKLLFAAGSIESLSAIGSFFGSSFNYSATTNQDGVQKLLKGTGVADINLQDLSHFNKKVANSLKPEGNLNVTFQSQMDVSDPSNINVKGEVTSGEAGVYKLKFQNVSGIFSLRDRMFILSPLRAAFYDGAFDLRAKIDTSGKDAILNLVAENVNIGGVTKTFLPPEKAVEGIMDMYLDLEAPDFKDYSTFSGQGQARIREGQLWKINLFQKLGKVIFIPGFENIVFTDGLAEFIIKDSNLVVDVLTLYSKAMTLRGQGKIGFDKSINFMFFPEVDTEVIGLSDDVRKITSAILGQGGFTLQVTGTLDKPDVKMESFVTSPVKQFKDLIEGIFKQ